MKIFTNKNTTKKIIIAVLIVMLFNFTTPTVSKADFGGALFRPISELLCGIGDLIISGLQNLFMGDAIIKFDSDIYAGGWNPKNDVYEIKYSPGAIFSGNVPALDVNFINPSEYKINKTVDYKFNVEMIGALINNNSGEILEGPIEYSNSLIKTKNGIIKEFKEKYNYQETNDITDEIKNSESINNFKIPTSTAMSEQSKDSLEIAWQQVSGEEVAIYIVLDYRHTTTSSNLQQSRYYAVTLYKYNDTLENLNKILEASGNISVEEITTDEEIISSAKTLRPVIATWYKALRAISLVGLLSVLVYIGIRIIISSTGQEKAKYKKMITDWVVAICILFVLQYIMVFTLEITKDITEVLSKSVVSEDGTDKIMTNLRQTIGNNTGASTIFFETIMYLVLVIYTCIFTIYYVKRLVYMAFFTMIAPLIALTYPLDKIKDGQAQAFTTWIREYVFNALIQPVHLLLYYIFVQSALDLSISNPIYAIVAIGFLIPAEKFFRKMFGFEKASSVSPIGAAAGGALVMNAINKIGQNTGKAVGKAVGGGSSSGSSNSGLRTGNGSALLGLQGGGNPGGGNPGGANPGGANPGGANPGGAAVRRNIKKGIGNVAKKQLFTRHAAQRNLRGMAKIFGGAAGATMGIAAGISTGDFSNAAKYGALGLVGGAKGAGGLVNSGFNAYDSVASGIDNTIYDFQTGELGEEEAQNRKFDREFFRSEDYKKIEKNYGIGARSNVQSMLNAGITDPSRMNTILKGMNKYGANISQAMAYNQLANDCGDSVLYDNKKLREFLNRRGITVPDSRSLQNLRQSIIDFK